MLFLPLGELSLYKAFFSDRVYEVSPPLYSPRRQGTQAIVTGAPQIRQFDKEGRNRNTAAKWCILLIV